MYECFKNNQEVFGLQIKLCTFYTIIDELINKRTSIL